jgi:alpha-tubulin suppressor-like RCC1 family protein
MRRSILHAIVASLFAFVLTGCSDDTLATGPNPAAKPNANTIGFPPPGHPSLPPSPGDFVQITAGSSHTCARKYNGTVYCWGVNNNGQAGIPSANTCPTIFINLTIPCIDRPTLLRVSLPQGGTDTLRATTIDAGSNHTCVIDPLSDGYCWGLNTLGQVGFPAGGSAVTQPTKVAGGLKYSFLSAGSQSTCGSGPSGVFCWGRIQGNATSPAFVSSNAPYGGLSVGDLHICVIGSAGGGIQCAGSNTYGQLSLDPATHPYANYVALANFNYPSSSVVTESNFTCANENVDMIECVGDNTYGQLGNGQSGTFTGTPQLVGGGQALHGVSAGYVHACALDDNNQAWCWGNGTSGQLGNNASSSSSTPQPVSGGHAFRAIAAGYQHTCAIGTDNHIYCWGINNFAQLGAHNPNSFVTTPVQALDPQ